ncbi:hypothetical protein [Haloarcula salinisoli]|uniref:Uncharacterized protein n=1 Tax=Haloarcula salinisoli TaxID=2487746 RepID=A0A8J8C9E3_9EURY|nr:hypothetical protein [Halomicroarcula salinisoli]MBX0286824.1 hypothetical protein [Halomicroarcula salinisoli]MBX0304124.1 hypothetical protein [Halomicroarcula salinisoli]
MFALQLRATGTEPTVALAVVALSALAIALSLAIAAVLVQGYRRGPGQRDLLVLAVGLLLLTTLPELLRVGLPTATGVGTVGRSVLVSGCELLGLGTILWVVYGGVSE